MYPILLTIGILPISSFGLFLLFSLILSSFIIWRISRVYEFDEEMVLDLILLTFVGGFLFSRFYFVVSNLNQFNDPWKILLINRYPGLSFWGGLFGGFITLKLFSRKFKIPFWELVDFAMVGLFLGISVASIGCLLGSCEYGLPSSSFFSVAQVGIIGRRFPIQIVESFIFFLTFFYLWRAVLRFHFTGKVAAVGLVLLGFYKFILEFYRGDRQVISLNRFNLHYDIWLSLIWSFLCISFGIKIFYKQSKRSFKADLGFILSIPINGHRRKLAISRVKKWCYNSKVNFKHQVSRWTKKAFKKINVKANPDQF